MHCNLRNLRNLWIKNFMRKQVSIIRHPSAQVQIPDTARIVNLALYGMKGMGGLYPRLYYRPANPSEGKRRFIGRSPF